MTTFFSLLQAKSVFAEAGKARIRGRWSEEPLDRLRKAERFNKPERRIDQALPS
jgi:hypothetical protein